METAVSVVIPSYNSVRYVCDAVDSVLAQTQPAHEIIVVDDGSTDDTRELLQKYGDKIKYIYQANAGVAAARNAGIRAATCGYIAFLDSDDMFHPCKLEIQLRHFANHPDLQLIATSHYQTEHPLWVDASTPSDQLDGIGVDQIITCSQFAPSSVLIKRSCLDSLGYFNCDLLCSEDRELWIRVATRFRVAKLPIPLTWYRMVSGSLSKDPVKMEYFERMLIDIVFAKEEFRDRKRFRAKVIASAYTASCLTFRCAGRPFTAIAKLIRSYCWWPWSFRATDYIEYHRGKILLSTIKSISLSVPKLLLGRSP